MSIVMFIFHPLPNFICTKTPIKTYKNMKYCPKRRERVTTENRNASKVSINRFKEEKLFVTRLP